MDDAEAREIYNKYAELTGGKKAEAPQPNDTKQTEKYIPRTVSGVIQWARSLIVPDDVVWYELMDSAPSSYRGLQGNRIIPLEELIPVGKALRADLIKVFKLNTNEVCVVSSCNRKFSLTKVNPDFIKLAPSPRQEEADRRRLQTLYYQHQMEDRSANPMSNGRSAKASLADGELGLDEGLEGELEEVEMVEI